MSAPNFWDNQEKAQGLIGELRRLNSTLKSLKELIQGGDDLQVLIEFADADTNPETVGEVRSQVETLRGQISGVELQASMASPEDAADAFITFQAGEGGTDSADFAEMLMRMCSRWAEDHNFTVEVLHKSDAEEAGIRSAAIAVRGDYAYGYLKSETGQHRLVRMSPFGSGDKRQTSFAAVDVVPDVSEDINIDIDWEKDVKEDKLRAQGAGGQHVNKTESAIRLTHLPTGVVAFCQNERSQHQNRSLAKKMLTAKLFQMEQEKRDAEQSARRGEKSKIGFGGQTIRNYVLQPEQFVKDTRSDLKTTNPLEVLDGKLDPFIEAYLRWTIAK
jgi:peptide chain release factor 2